MTVYFLPNGSKLSTFEVLFKAAAILHSSGVRLVADGEHAQQIGSCPVPVEILTKENAFEQCDFVVTIGGDGTMLHAARSAMKWQKPLLGINTGRLGFLTIAEQDELEKLSRLPKGEYSIEHRSVIAVQGQQGSGFVPGLALNDIVFFKQSAEKTISLDIYCDDVLVSSFRGDGVIFATPTGSTAYSMSAGGPVVDARLQAITVTQICAHIVHTPPLVFSAERKLRVVPKGGLEEQILVSCDGKTSQPVGSQETMEIRQSGYTVPLVQFADADQLKFIDMKLKGR